MGSFPLSPLDPDIRLIGDVSEDMAEKFWDEMQEARSDQNKQSVFLCLTTLGGEADIGRRIAEDIKLWQSEGKQDIYFLGKTSVYSAGVTIMSAFPKDKRFLTSDTTLLIHERSQSSTVDLKGPSDRILDIAQDIITKTKNATRLEKQGFEDLAKGTGLSCDEICKRAKLEWYLTAEEAKNFDLIEGIIDGQARERILKAAA